MKNKNGETLDGGGDANLYARCHGRYSVDHDRRTGGRQGGNGKGGQPPHMNDEHERQFQLQLEHIRKQTELEQARMQGRKNPC